MLWATTRGYLSLESGTGARHQGSRTREQYPHHDKTDSGRIIMAWIVLILSGALESVWAAALSASRGFKRRKPVVVFLIAMAISVGGLAWAMQFIPTGTAYAVWVGIGATLTVIYGFINKQEKPTRARILLLMLLVGSVIGLQVVS